MIDYHIHTDCSFDCSAPALEQHNAAAKLGLKEICFTDHVDFDNPDALNRAIPADLSRLRDELTVLERSGCTPIIKYGAEVGLSGESSSQLAWEYIKDAKLDYIIGSVHVVNGIDTFYPEYYYGKTKQKAYVDYIETILKCIKCCDYFSAMGHYDFVAKYAPYENRRMSYSIASEAFDEIFKLIIESGRCIEINTSAWRDEDYWGIDILKRYVQLGGQYVMFGSDAHKSENIARRFDEALELALSAGIKYTAVFSAMKPRLIPLSEF